jgi:hypothetical protein
MLFEVINARYLKSSTITTSHVGISSWADRLGDPMLAPPWSTGCCTAASSSASTARPTGCAPTSNAPNSCAGR